MMISFSPPWALIRAGGDGARLRALTTQISGDPRLRVKDVHGSDWGNPARVAATILRTGWRPSWLERVELPVAG